MDVRGKKGHLWTGMAEERHGEKELQAHLKKNEVDRDVTKKYDEHPPLMPSLSSVLMQFLILTAAIVWEYYNHVLTSLTNINSLSTKMIFIFKFLPMS